MFFIRSLGEPNCKLLTHKNTSRTKFGHRRENAEANNTCAIHQSLSFLLRGRSNAEWYSRFAFMTQNKRKHCQTEHDDSTSDERICVYLVLCSRQHSEYCYIRSMYGCQSRYRGSDRKRTRQNDR